jgi:hypothetical protein
MTRSGGLRAQVARGRCSPWLLASRCIEATRTQPWRRPGGLLLAGNAAITRAQAERDDIGAQEFPEHLAGWYDVFPRPPMKGLGRGIDALQFDDGALTDPA